MNLAIVDVEERKKNAIATKKDWKVCLLILIVILQISSIKNSPKDRIFSQLYI